jgi:hypothetical protein
VVIGPLLAGNKIVVNQIVPHRGAFL